MTCWFSQSLFIYVTKLLLSLACDRLDSEFCGACLREGSISGSRLQLFDLFSQKTGKKEGEMNKWQGPLQQFLQACVFFSRSADFYHREKKLYQHHSIHWEFGNSTWVDDASPLLHRIVNRGAM